MNEMDKAKRLLEQQARELAPETESFEQFATEFGFGDACERCGREGLDDDDYTDCELVPDPNNRDGPWLLVCHDCFTDADKAAQQGAR